MASAKITLGIPRGVTPEATDMIIVGGGICGILAAKNCHDRGLSYKLIEREACLGGNWHTMANTHSHLQVRPPPAALVINLRVKCYLSAACVRSLPMPIPD